MIRRWLEGWAVVGVAAGVSGPAAAEFPKHRVKPCPLCGLPDYGYRPAEVRPNPTVTAVSLTRVPAVAATPALSPPVISVHSTAFPAPVGVVVLPPVVPVLQVYQLAESRLRIDHCFLSRVAVTLDPDGRYQVSFRADQNPQPGTDARSPLRRGERVETLTTLQTNHLRRNLFVVKVRGYGVYPARGGRPAVAPGPPVLFELPLPEFWVQRGEPYAGLFEGRCTDIARFLDLTDRVEVEFTYR